MTTASYIDKTASTKWLKSVIGITLFMPSFFGYMGLGAGQMVLLLVLLGFFAYMGLSKGKIYDFALLTKPVIPFLILSLLYACTIALSTVIVENPTFKDFFDIVRPLIYAGYFIISFSLIRKDLDIDRLLMFFANCLLAMTVLDFLKFMQSFYPIMRLYTVFDYGSINYLRFQGTFCFCYNYGFLLLFGLMIMLYNKALKRRWIYIILFSIFIIATGSRSVIAGFFFILCLYFLFHGMGLFKKVLTFIVVIAVFVAGYFSLKEVDAPIIRVTIGYVERMVESLVNGQSSDGSLNARNSQLDFAIESMERNPLFGVGPQKGEGEPIEIMFGYYISSWGILGTVCFLTILSTFFYYAYVSSKFEDKSIAAFSNANMMWLVGVFFVGLSTPIVDQIRVSNIFYLFQAIQFYYYIQYRNEQKKSLQRILQ